MLRSHRLLFPIFFLVLFGILILSGTWGATAAALLLAGGEVYAGFDYDQDRYNAPSEVSFSDTSSADDSIDSWYWDFGDGTTSKEQNPVHIFADADEYQVSLTVTAGGSSDTATETIYVDENDLGIYFWPYEGPAPLEVEFEVDAYDGFPDEVLWDFGDDETSESFYPSHTYDEPGQYDVTLSGWYYDLPDPYVYECDDCVYVYENPTADFIASHTTGLPPLTVTFTSTTSLPWLVDYYQWIFGDGSSSQSGEYASHVYTATGEFQAELWAYPEEGDPSIATKTIKVKELYADFEVDHRAGPAPLTVQFTDLSEYLYGPVERWNWDFGDGKTSQAQNPIHTYSNTDLYTVSLQVGAGMLEDTIVKTDYILVESAHDFDVLDIFCEPDLDPSWDWYMPLSGPSYSLSERTGYFRLMVPDYSTYDHGYSDDAPQLLNTLIDDVALARDTWTVETSLDLTGYTVGSGFHTGLAVRFGTYDILY